jgi:hypothetical protein
MKRASDKQIAAVLRQQVGIVAEKAHSNFVAAVTGTDCVGGGLGSPRPLRTPKYLAPPFSQAGPSFCAARLVAPAVRSPGMTNGGSGDANTTNSGPTWAAAKANLREHAVRLRKRRGRYCLRGSCESYDKTSSSNQPNHFCLPSGHLCLFRRIVSPIC